jgi:hypothetical protein
MKINKSELFSKVLSNVLFISIFIAFFFFTYGSYIEKKVVKNQMEFLSEHISNIIKLGGKNINKDVINFTNNIKVPDLSKEDKDASTNNKKITLNVIKINILFFIIVFSIIIYIYLNYGNNTYNLGQIISNNLVILLFIALTEFIFWNFFASKFISIDPNKTKLSIIQALKKNNYI